MNPLIPAALILCAGTAIAQQGPSFDCAKAESSAEEAICGDPYLSELDRNLTARFNQALQVAQGYGGADDLRAYQRGWIGGRDDCWKADDLKSCIETAYLRRDAELVTQFMLEDPTGTTYWSCDGNPANEVVTSYFDTAIPSVRFERGDSIDTGTLSPTGSGSRYDGSFGRFIWIKGDQATYRDPDPDGTEVTCTVRQ